jgi:ABC-type transporter Mla maintaining outer membrane lipid asymmetry ATPase subunit MlaF
MTNHEDARGSSFSFPGDSPGKDDPAIRVQGLTKSFGSRTVLRDFSLDVRPGEMLAIVGGSGSGKSVFLKHLAGLMRPDLGSIVIAGTDIVRAPKERIEEVHRRIGYLFQDGGLLNSLTIYDNVALPLREIERLPEEEIRSRVTDRLRQVGVAGEENKVPGELSGGMRKRAGLARAIVTERSFFFFDEPTSALDPVTAGSIRALIREVHEQWKSTSLIVTHDLRLVAQVADRIAFLIDGAIRQTGTFDDMVRSSDPIIREFFADSDCLN